MTPSDRKWFLINAFPVLFLIANLRVWWLATPIGFRRFGSVGVMVAALMFGLDRISRRHRGRARRGSDDLMLTELGLVAVSTFHWGYCDLFHCWSDGQGWQMCE